MKPIAHRLAGWLGWLVLSVWLVVAGCGGEAVTAPDAKNTAIKKVPSNIDKSFNDLLKELEQKIANNFWTNGGKGTSETTFDMDAYAAYMKQKGLAKKPNSLMDYAGDVNGIHITIAHKTASDDHGGWLQQFAVQLQQGGYIRKKEFSVTR